jgi:hypothetical protein
MYFDVDNIVIHRDDLLTTTQTVPERQQGLFCYTFHRKTSAGSSHFLGVSYETMILLITEFMHVTPYVIECVCNYQCLCLFCIVIMTRKPPTVFCSLPTLSSLHRLRLSHHALDRKLTTLAMLIKINDKLIDVHPSKPPVKRSSNRRSFDIRLLAIPIRFVQTMLQKSPGYALAVVVG